MPPARIQVKSANKTPAAPTDGATMALHEACRRDHRAAKAGDEPNDAPPRAPSWPTPLSRGATRPVRIENERAAV